MGQDQSTQQGGGVKPQTTTTSTTTNNNIQNHADPLSNNSSPRPNRQQGLLNFTTLDSTTSSASTSTSLAVVDPLANVPKAFHNDDEVLAIWRQLESIQLPYPILRSTGMNPDQEVSSLVQQMNLISENSSTSAFSSSSSSSTNNSNNNNNNNASGRESSPTLESISKYISELKRKAQSASKELMNNTSPNLRDRTTEVKIRLQKPAGTTTTPSASPAPSAATSRAGSPQTANTVANSVSTDSHVANPSDAAALVAPAQQQQHHHDQDLLSAPLPAFAPSALLQALGRPQTLCLKEISNVAAPRCEKMVVDAVKLAQELQSLKSGALQQIRHGQKCYSVETEVKRLHVELHGADRSSATGQSIGHNGPFPPLLSVCDDTAVLLDKIHALLGEEPRRRLQEYAAGIDARSLVRSPLMSPVKTKK